MFVDIYVYNFNFHTDLQKKWPTDRNDLTV